LNIPPSMAIQRCTDFEHAVEQLRSILPSEVVDGLLQAHYMKAGHSMEMAVGHQSVVKQQHLPWGQAELKPHVSSAAWPVALEQAPQLSFSALHSPAPCAGCFSSPPPQAGSTGQISSVSFRHRGAALSGARPPPKELPERFSAIGSLLKDLDGVSPNRVVKVRKVHKLGPHAFAALRQHCGQYGRVDDVLALQTPQGRRVRPSSLAFVVMRDALAADALLQAGWEQTVMGTRLLLERYEQRDLGASNSMPCATGLTHATCLVVAEHASIPKDLDTASTASTISTSGASSTNRITTKAVDIEDASSCAGSPSCTSPRESSNSDNFSEAFDLLGDGEQATYDPADFEYWPTDDEWE